MHALIRLLGPNPTVALGRALDFCYEEQLQLESLSEDGIMTFYETTFHSTEGPQDGTELNLETVLWHDTATITNDHFAVQIMEATRVAARLLLVAAYHPSQIQIHVHENDMRELVCNWMAYEKPYLLQ